MGPTVETYRWIEGLLGKGHAREQDAKEAASDFFQGVAAALCTLYGILVEAGKANAIDAEITGKIMEQHPELDKGEQKVASLWIPKFMTKTASGGVGGAGSGYPAYVMHGPGENKYCPKIRQPVSEFICRFHCLDGLAVDNSSIVCGEAIWRQAVMDKFSRPYRNAKGEWVGGYLNKRFEIHYDDGGHPYLLKPGTRMHPIHEDAWITEKRLQEMRRAESSKRGYCETPGDPKGLYNFDQHELLGGSKPPNLSEKPKDELSKIATVKVASSMFETKTAACPQDPGQIYGLKEAMELATRMAVESADKTGMSAESRKELGKTPVRVQEDGRKALEKIVAGTPWSVPIFDAKTAEKTPEFNKRRKEGKSPSTGTPWSVPSKEASWKLAQTSPQGPGGGDPTGAMMDNVYNGPCCKRCPVCDKRYKNDAALKTCLNPACRGAALVDVSVDEQKALTGGIEKPASVTLSCGVFKAASGSLSAFGDSPEEALGKLAQKAEGLGALEMPSVEDLSAQIGAVKGGMAPETGTAVSPPAEPAPEPPMSEPIGTKLVAEPKLEAEPVAPEKPQGSQGISPVAEPPKKATEILDETKGQGTELKKDETGDAYVFTQGGEEDWDLSEK